MASPTNPLSRVSLPPPPPATTFHIAGLTIHVQGLSALPTPCTTLSILYLLHPRLQSASSTLPLGAHLLTTWHHRRAALPPSHPAAHHGLLTLSFDARNHGSRLVSPVANGSWRDGNPRHAQDMFGTYAATAADVRVLLDHVGSYLFETLAGPPPKIERSIVVGVSLGGHAAWQLLFADPRVEAAVVVIGCPDYMRVMTDRARLSKLPSYTRDGGASFVGSRDFPPALVRSVCAHDPRGLLFGTGEIPTDPPVPRSAAEAARLRALLEERVRGKALLVCSGGADKLVPAAAGAPFVGFLREAVGEGGWWAGGMGVREVVYEGVGHEVSEGMVGDCGGFVVGVLEERGGRGGGEADDGNRGAESKM